MSPSSAPSVAVRAPRRVELDVLRLVLVLGLVLFHAALVFDTHDDFYVKNQETAELTGVAAAPIIVWAMPALFAIAGIAARYSLRRRTAGAFARERLLRLGLPLLVVTVLLTPIPQWIRARATSPDLGYLDFLPRFFDVRLEFGAAPFFLTGEWFEFGHLWFVVLLLAWSLVLALLVAVLPAGAARALRDAVRRVGERAPVALLAPAVVAAGLSAVLPLEQGYAAWNRWAYLLFFLAGFALLGDDALRAAQRRIAGAAALVAVALFAGGVALFLVGGGQELFLEVSPAGAGFRALYGATGWCTVVAIIGGLDRLAERRARRAAAAGPGRERPAGRGAALLGFLGPIALPLYLLHQPIVVVLAALVTPLTAPPLAEFALIVVASYAVLFALVEVLRRIPLTRILLGMPWSSAPTRRDVPQRAGSAGA